MAGVLELQQSELQQMQKHSAIRKWADTLCDLNKRLTDKISYDKPSNGGDHYSGFGGDDDYEMTN